MAVAKRDYYEVLGVSRDADSEEIRRAFHALARDWHPDVAEGTEAETRFRELAEAYTVLSKQESRLLYDRYGYRGRGNPAVEGASGDAENLEVTRGEDIHAELELRHYEAEEGARPVLTFNALATCPGCMGQGSFDLPDPECEYCFGTGERRTAVGHDAADLLEVEPCPACMPEACTLCDGRGTVETERKLRLRIPPGVEDGTQLRVAGEGSEAGAPVPGDLFVRLHVLPPPKDPRAIRYTALALLVLAVAALALYVIR